ncbi:MAG TPA: DUF3592 domain-containing protein [Alphaproteobacteria bacterium]|nr:DUF3592 domain-containing protein [Alphaproteobacteria bacterium]
MFDFTFDAIMAFHQAVFLTGGLIMSLLGGAIVLYCLHTYLRALRVPAIITGVRRSGNMFYPLYRYMMPSGDTYETVSDTGSNMTKGKETGREVIIYVFPEEPQNIRTNLLGIFLLGCVFLVPGLVLLGVGLFSYPMTGMSFAALAIFIVVGLMRMRKIWLPPSERKGVSAFRAEMQRRREEKFGKMERTTIEDYKQTPAGQKYTTENEQAQRMAMPILALMGIAALWGAWYFGNSVYELTVHGAQAEGVVTGFETSRGSDSTIYRARVSFTDARSENHVFTERSGSSHPFVEEGEKVAVLYAPDAPSEKAMIDRGLLLNALVPALIGLMGAGFLGLSASMWRARRRAVENR